MLPQVRRAAYCRMSRAVATGVVLLALAREGCASLECRPATIVVARKEERTRVDDSVRAVRTDSLGRLEGVRSYEVVPEYWVYAQDGSSYRVPRDRFLAAEPGQPLE